MAVIPAERGIEGKSCNCGEHGKPGVTGSRASSMLIRAVQANRQSVYEPLNFHW